MAPSVVPGITSNAVTTGLQICKVWQSFGLAKKTKNIVRRYCDVMPPLNQLTSLDLDQHVRVICFLTRHGVLLQALGRTWQQLRLQLRSSTDSRAKLIIRAAHFRT